MVTDRQAGENAFLVFHAVPVDALRRDAFAPKPAAVTCGRCDFVRMCSAGSAMVS